MKYKHMAKRALLWLLLFVSTTAPLPCFAIGIETLPYPEGDDVCKYQDSIKMTGPKWWDKPMTAALNASVAIGNGVFKNVAKGAIRLMIVGGMLWLAVFVLKIVGGMVESDPMENVTKIGGMMLRIGIAAALLSSPNFFFSYFFAPIIEAGAGFVGVGGSSTNIDGGLASAAGAARGMADAIHESVAGVQADAWHLKCMSKIHKLSLGFDFTFWDPGIFFSGCMIYAAAIAFGLVFPFFLIDACFRMGVVAALCPLFIVAWVFQSTRDYASKGFQATLNVAFTFMMVKIAMDIALKMIVGSSGLGSISDGPDAEKLALCTYRFVNFSDSDPCADYSSGTAGTTSNILIFTASVIYGLLLLRQGSSELAGYFAGASFSNDTAFQAAKGGAQAMVSGAHHAVSGTAKVAGGAAAVAGAIANSKVGKAVGGAIKNSAVGRMASRVQSARKNHQERRMQRRADVKQAVGDKFQAAGDAVRQGGRNLRNNIRGKLGMQSVEEKQQAKYDANAKQRDANEKARQERQSGRKERAENRAKQWQELDARKRARAKVYASGDKDKIAEARKQEKADLKLEQNLRNQERMDAKERANDAREKTRDDQQAARDRAQASRNDFTARAGQRELNRADRISNHMDRKNQRRDDLSNILHGDAGRPDALKQEGGKAADNSGAKADNNAVPPPPPPPPARPAEPPKGVSKNARFDEKTQTWMTTSTDKTRGGLTTEVHYDNSGKIVSRTQYDGSNRMISDEQMKDGKTSQKTQSFNSKGELTQKTVTTKSGNTRILGVEGGNVVSNTVTHGDGTVDRIPVGKNTADSAGVVEDKNGNRSGK